MRRGSRAELRDTIGTEKPPALRLSDGTVIAHSREILAGVARQD